MKIDVVVPYVDFNDKEWQKRAEKNGIVIDKVRFRGQGDFFKYFFRCIDKNISWINNIFLIVQSESQVPKWINKEKVKIILHEEIIPKEFLPVYSSCTIEMFIHNIKELEEHFLYFNDDMFVIKELLPSSFFENNKVRQTFMNCFPKGIYGSHVKNSYMINFNDENKLLPIHSIQPLLKSKVIECFNLYKDNILKSISKLREDKNYNVYIYMFYLKKLGLCDTSNIVFRKVANYNYRTFLCIRFADIICINDEDTSFNIYENKDINKWFEEHFKEKSKYEL